MSTQPTSIEINHDTSAQTETHCMIPGSMIQQDLVARVAATRVKKALNASLTETSLFAVFDFSGQQTRRILEEICAEEPNARIAIHPDAIDGSIPEEWRSDQPLTYWRNLAREDGDRLIVSAVTTTALDRLGETAATIQRISPEHLKQDIDAWFTASTNLHELQGRDATYLRNAIQGLLKTDIPTNISLFAKFVCELDSGLEKDQLNKALNSALTVLRIPPEAAQFSPPGDRGKLTSPESWATKLTELYNKVSDVAYLRDEQGKPLDRDAIRLRVNTLHAEGGIDADEVKAWNNLLDDQAIEPGEWQETQRIFTEMKWTSIQKIIKPKRNAKDKPLGKATTDYLDKEKAGALTEVEREILERVDESRNADPEEAELYGKYHLQIEKDKKLNRKWEQFVFREVKTHPELLAGLIHTVYEMANTAAGEMEGRIVFIRLSKANELDFWRKHQIDACLTLRDRYRGITAAMPTFVKLDCGICWSRDWADDIDADSSHSGGEVEFKFEAYLLKAVDLLEDGSIAEGALTGAPKTQMVWAPAIKSIALKFSDHLRAIAPKDDGSALLLHGIFSRTAKDSTSGNKSLRLTDRRTVDDVNNNEDGQLFDPNNNAANVSRQFTDNLHDLRSRGVITDQSYDILKDTFDEFSLHYASAINAFLTGNGINSESLIDQARTYGFLLQLLRAHAPGDECRKGLWLPVTQIGVARSRNVPGAILTPFFPLRLAEIALKTRMTRETMVDMASAGDDVNLRTFARRAEEDCQRSWFTDFQIAPRGSHIYAMTENVHLDDYSYLEPIADYLTTGDEQGTYTKQASDNLMKVLSEHLDLHPHNVANFSVVLYNSESRDLPSAVAERLAKRVDEDNRLRCDLVIASDNRKRLRQIYAEQNISIGRELDTSGGAELTKEFLSNLRVGIGDVEHLASSDSDNKPHDVAFLQDVFARNAETKWRRVIMDGGFPDFDLSTRSSDSRRQIQMAGENRTRVLLASPNRPYAVQAYLDLASEIVSDVDDQDRRDQWEPMREISFGHPDNRTIIDRAHNIADWVVTFDAIADQRLFKQNGISVIRSVPIDDAKHNLVVSTSAHKKSLTKRIAEMVSDATGNPARHEILLAKKLIDISAELSGQIVLRAANRDQAALELIGLSLSEKIINSSMRTGEVPIAWFFLDDFKSRLGHGPGDKVADLLLVSAISKEDSVTIHLRVVEAKYSSKERRSEDATKSSQQTQTSMSRIRKWLVEADGLNASAHASQMADLLVEHGTFDDQRERRNLKNWISSIREKSANIQIEGISLIFSHDDLNAASAPKNDDDFHQYFYTREDVVQILGCVSNGKASKPLGHITFDNATASPEVAGDPHTIGQKTKPNSIAHDELSIDSVGVHDIGVNVNPTSQLSDDSVGQSETEAIISENIASVPNTSAGSFRGRVQHLIDTQTLPEAEIEAQAWMVSTEGQLRKALKNYGMTCEVVGSRLTPNAALIRFRGNDNMTVDLVQKKASPLFTSHGLEVVAVRPAKGEVIVMVARDDRVILPTLDLWRRRELPSMAPYRNSSFVLGEREDNGEILYLNLGGAFAGQPQHGPHTLIAGETGGGKGVLTSNLLMDICATNSPTAARIHLVDPKAGIDYGWLEGVPHLAQPIITDPSGAIKALEDLVIEMEDRIYKVFAPNKVNNIDTYNNSVSEENKMPRIYFFHDELADWIIDKSDINYGDIASHHIQRLGQKARAAGIHLFLITQRPDKDALPGAIKANMGNKIALKVSNRTNSQIILDDTGAEMLLGNGHMIAKLSNQPGGMIYAQAPYLDPTDAHSISKAVSLRNG